MDAIVIYLCLPIAYLLDLLLGDPSCLPHPVVAFGKTIRRFDILFNKGKHKRFKGFFSSFILIACTYLFFFFTFRFILSIHVMIYAIVNIVFIFYGLANKTLIREGRMVFNQLKEHGLESGRKQVSRIVGRNTDLLNEYQIKTAVLETLSENLSDGVIAPLFYYAIGGVPAMMTYKMVNTLDSMIGYKNDKYIQFGWFAAHLDDIANFIPARITALLIATLSRSMRSFRFIVKYGKSHSSPNAGYPEAALAGVLNCQFGGNMQYGDLTCKKPFIGINKREIIYQDLKQSIAINHSVCFVTVIIITFIQWQLV